MILIFYITRPAKTEHVHKNYIYPGHISNLKPEWNKHLNSETYIKTKFICLNERSLYHNVIKAYESRQICKFSTLPTCHKYFCTTTVHVHVIIYHYRLLTMHSFCSTLQNLSNHNMHVLQRIM